jgi:hypothetical protein
VITNAADVAAQLVAACTPPPTKPVLTCFVRVQGISDILRGAVSTPSYTFPESAARDLGQSAVALDARVSLTRGATRLSGNVQEKR